MNSAESIYQINRTPQNFNKQPMTDAFYKITLDYINKNSKKSPSTNAFYARKYADLKSKERMPNPFGELEVREENYFDLHTLFPELFKIPFPQPKRPSFTFIDLFSGIGGFFTKPCTS